MNASAKTEAAATARPFWNVDLELATIGRIIDAREPGAFHEARGHCSPADFLSDACGHVLDLCEVIDAEGEAISFLTVLARLGNSIKQMLGADQDAKGFLEGAIALALTRPYSDASTRALAKQVADLAQRRRIDAELEAGRLRLAENNSPITAAIGGVIEVVGDAVDRAARARGHRNIGDIADGILRKTEAAMNGEPIPAIRTGLARLDSLSGGFHAGDLCIIAGRPGMGKTVMLGAIALRAAMAGYPALIFSLEMPGEQLAERMACDVDYDARAHDQKPLFYENFRSGNVSDGEFSRLYAALATIRGLPLEIHDSGGMSMPEIAAVAERYAARSGKPLGAVVIDYLQLVTPGNRYAGRKVDEIGEITGTGKALAKRIGWPVVMGCQLNRSVEGRDNKRPTQADLRDSGAIEQDADLIAGLYREAYYVRARRPARGRHDPGFAGWLAEYRAVADEIEIALLKNRHGRTAAVTAFCDIGASAIRNRPGESAISIDEYPEDYIR